MHVPTSACRVSPSGGSVRAASALWLFALATVILVLTGRSAAAHTQLDDTDPADGSTSTTPVSEVVLTFSLPVTPLGDAVVVTGPDGPVATTVALREDGEAVVATVAAPLGAGDYLVEWTVAAQDGHPLDGSFGFAVVGPSAAPSPSGGSATPGGGPSPTPTQAAAPSPSMSADPEGAGAGGDALARSLARLGAAIALWSLLVGGGALAFAALAMRGSDRADVSRVLAGVRWCGALLLGGLAVRLLGRSALLADGSVADGIGAEALETALAGTFAWVFGLQAVGGLLMLLGAWRSVGASWLALTGILVAGAGHVLGGHSNTAEPRWLVLVADVTHLVAAAIWVGGVLALVRVLRTRRRAGAPLDVARMAARFGVVAAASFVVVGLAGVALAWAIVDDVSDLWTSTWGVVLLAKVAVVLVVGALGAYTHFRVVPRLTARTDGSARAVENSHLSRAAGAESVLFGFIVLATAILVASSVHA